MDITPLIADDKKIINGYGESSFKINGENYKGSIIITPDKVVTWDVTSLESINLDFIASLEDIEVLLIGGGIKHLTPSSDALKDLHKSNIGFEFMTTGAACRTYNVLLSEGRNVAAALIAV